MFPSSAVERERENYSKRDNGYAHSPYDDRVDPYAFRRNEPYSHSPRDDRLYNYRQKRDWVIDREYQRGYDTNPSPGKRRRTHDMDSQGVPYYLSSKEYKPRHTSYESPRYPPRSLSRSPSPSKTIGDKERYAREYYEREPYKPYREREGDYNRPNFYYPSRGGAQGRPPTGWDSGRPPMNSSGSGNKYDYGRHYDNGGYRRESSYEGDYRRSYEKDYDKEYEKDYDSRYNKDYLLEKPREYTRDRYDYRDDREHSRERDLYDNRQIKREREGDLNLGSNAISSPNTNPMERVDSTKDSLSSTEEPAPLPTEAPKKKLGWGQGLMAKKKKEDLIKEETLVASPTIPAEKTPIKELELTETKEVEMEVEPLDQFTDVPSSTGIQDSITNPSFENKVKFEPKDEVPPQEEAVQILFPSFPSKEEVLLSIERVDAEIAKTELLIHNLKKPKKPEHKHHRSFQSIKEEIYEDNKEKAAQSFEEFSKFIHPLMTDPTQPLYKKPEDLEMYQMNIKKHDSIRSEIAAVIWRRKKETHEKENELVNQYKMLHEKWRKKIHTIEAKRKRKEQKQQKHVSNSLSMEDSHQIRRPILRSQVRGVSGTLVSDVRTPRGSRSFGLTDTVRSEAEFSEILSHLREEDDKDPNSKYIKTIAKTPPMVLDPHAPRFIDKNGLVEDPMAVERERKMGNPWSEEEKILFLRKFTQYGKYFSKIATFLENKSTSDVIWYYYANKKTLDLKKILQEQQTKRRGLARKMQSAAIAQTNSGSNVPRELANLGVTTQNWLSESGRAQRTTVRNVNYAEPKDEFMDKLSRPALVVGDTESKWNEAEKELFLEGLAKFSKDFKTISNHMGTKTEFQCQNYYHNNKKKLNLDQIIQEGTVWLQKRKKNQGTPKAELDDGRKGPREERRIENTWTDSEKADFLKYYKQYGKNWKKIASNLPSKSQNQIKYYFQVTKTKLNLESIVATEPEDTTVRKRGRKPNPDKPRKIRKTRGDDSDGTNISSPLIVESPNITDDIAQSPLSETTIVSSLLSLASTATSLEEIPLAKQSFESPEESSEGKTIPATMDTTMNEAPRTIQEVNQVLSEPNQVPPESNQMESESYQDPSESNQMESESHQVQSEPTQVPPESNQMESVSHQDPSESNQMEPETLQDQSATLQVQSEPTQVSPESNQLESESHQAPSESTIVVELAKEVEYQSPNNTIANNVEGESLNQEGDQVKFIQLTPINLPQYEAVEVEIDSMETNQREVIETFEMKHEDMETTAIIVTIEDVVLPNTENMTQYASSVVPEPNTPSREPNSITEITNISSKSTDVVEQIVEAVSTEVEHNIISEEQSVKNSEVQDFLTEQLQSLETVQIPEDQMDSTIEMDVTSESVYTDGRPEFQGDAKIEEPTYCTKEPELIPETQQVIPLPANEFVGSFIEDIPTTIQQEIQSQYTTYEEAIEVEQMEEAIEVEQMEEPKAVIKDPSLEEDTPLTNLLFISNSVEEAQLQQPVTIEEPNLQIEIDSQIQPSPLVNEFGQGGQLIVPENEVVVSIQPTDSTQQEELEQTPELLSSQFMEQYQRVLEEHEEQHLLQQTGEGEETLGIAPVNLNEGLSVFSGEFSKNPETFKVLEGGYLWVNADNQVDVNQTALNQEVEFKEITSSTKEDDVYISDKDPTSESFSETT